MPRGKSRNSNGIKYLMWFLTIYIIAIVGFITATAINPELTNLTTFTWVFMFIIFFLFIGLYLYIYFSRSSSGGRGKKSSAFYLLMVLFTVLVIFGVIWLGAIAMNPSLSNLSAFVLYFKAFFIFIIIIILIYMYYKWKY